MTLRPERHLSLTPLVSSRRKTGHRDPAPGPARPCPERALPDPQGETWLTPDEAELLHGQVWWVRTTGGAELWAQLDGYDTVSGRQVWRAIGILSHRQVRVRKVLAGTCPRTGGRRARR